MNAMNAHISSLLFDANRQIQIADHLLSTTYPLVKDPKLLISVIEHQRRAIEDAMQAILLYDAIAPDHTTDQNAVQLFTKHKHNILSGESTILLYNELQATLKEYKEAPTTFIREEKLIIAREGFTILKEVTPHALAQSMHESKKFVHECHQRIALAQ